MRQGSPLRIGGWDAFSAPQSKRDAHPCASPAAPPRSMLSLTVARMTQRSEVELAAFFCWPGRKWAMGRGLPSPSSSELGRNHAVPGAVSRRRLGASPGSIALAERRARRSLFRAWAAGAARTGQADTAITV